MMIPPMAPEISRADREIEALGATITWPPRASQRRRSPINKDRNRRRLFSDLRVWLAFVMTSPALPRFSPYPIQPLWQKRKLNRLRRPAGPSAATIRCDNELSG